MTEIVLTTFNARWIHAAFGLRYLLANLGDLQSRAEIIEFEIHKRPTDAIEELLARVPHAKIVGLGVYIWNAEVSRQFVAELKRLRPDLFVVLGGPEVSHETDMQEIVALADCTITGEADLEFGRLCRMVLDGKRPTQRVIAASLPDFTALNLPYTLYDETDVRHRVVYVEASRGCPFSCEFCLSSLEIPVRQAPLEPFLTALQTLYQRGVQHFKFVDRTFNLNFQTSSAILQFFLERLRPGLFVHFEMIPDRLPPRLRELIVKFPPGTLQFEVGIQTFNPAVAARISRRQDNAKAEDNLRWLRENTGVHIHADLIAGLPGEDLASFGEGFNRLWALRPQEIQVGILKRLRGTPIVRHDREWGMVYSPVAPYEVLQTTVLDFATLQRLKRFSRYWDVVANSGNFNATLERLMTTPGHQPFTAFLGFSDFVFERTRQTHSLALHRIAGLLFEFMTQRLGLERATVGGALATDYLRCARHDWPEFLREFVKPETARHLSAEREATRAGAKRQTRHAVNVPYEVGE